MQGACKALLLQVVGFLLAVGHATGVGLTTS